MAKLRFKFGYLLQLKKCNIWLEKIQKMVYNIKVKKQKKCEE